MATSPMDAATVKEAADMLAKRIVVLRLQKQAGGLSDYVEPVVNKATELVDKAAPHVQKFYQNNTMPIHAGLAGAGIGAAMGGLSGLTSPDPDRRNPGRSALMGGLAGGALGGGIGMLAQHGPELQKLLGVSGDAAAEQAKADSANGWLRSAMGGKRTWGEVAKDPLYGGAAARAAGLGSWGQNVAAYGAPIALGNEARLFNNARNPLSASNIQAGAAELAAEKKKLQPLSDLMNRGVTTPIDHMPNLRGALADMQMHPPPFIRPVAGLQGSALDSYLKSQGSHVTINDAARLLGSSGRVANNSVATIAKGVGKFGGRAGLYALLPFLASSLQPNTTPKIPSSFSQVFGK